MKHIAIIPARSGSKGLPDKNIKLLDGKPLLAYSITAAKESGLFDTIFVSTDSKEYAQIGRQWGADIPFLRSEELAQDTSSTWDTVYEAISRYQRMGKSFDTITLLQPTSPLRTGQDIINGFELLKEKNADAVIGVCEEEHSPLWSNTIPEDLNMKTFIRKEILHKRRQELPSYYRINGALYIIKSRMLKHIENLYEENCFAYIMDKRRSIDIDDVYDFQMAEYVIKMQRELSGKSI